MKIVNNKFISKKILFIFFLFIVSCDIKKEKDLREFNPEMITKLDLNKTDSVILEKYYNDKRVFTEWVKFKYKIKVDTAFTEFKSAKYKFKLKKKFDVGYNYKIIFNMKNRKYLYFLQNFDYDIVHTSTSKCYGIKAYILNGKKRTYRCSKFYLDKTTADGAECGMNE